MQMCPDPLIFPNLCLSASCLSHAFSHCLAAADLLVFATPAVLPETVVRRLPNACVQDCMSDFCSAVFMQCLLSHVFVSADVCVLDCMSFT